MEWWEVLVQQTINGLTRGAVFALIALGYTMVYGIIELINFAHPDVFPSVDILREWFGVDSAIFVTTKDLLVVGATIPLMLALHYFVTRTTWGKAMRATAQDRETAEAMGINVERTIVMTFFIGGALAGSAGLLPGMYYNIGPWWMGYQGGLRALHPAVVRRLR